MDAEAREAAMTVALRTTGYYVECTPDVCTAEQLRSLGRRIGRRLGCRVQTLQQPRATESDGPFTVQVYLIEEDPLHQQQHHQGYWSA